ncbi:uncharacterized protein LACBIDRAFT_330941 [Laccaria bicolor S238N-H82]|uniref:Predicted protein n=1 Tax=Laccaria bicolor (strain S238N-H82 / ATCC MYA-4686) TaxID=486041 RepID=B0DMR1_LACBS|nr:uncharacterized protein LACBIDRAFT_330941 [Laccaria bicolor S238N-H82]EDR04099.1 predicted protein [Laccaria bicolor S238N-H82]|eukprot:XP_001885354.1 predicted protein [Laccaria bicolor S238N-H82]
MTIRDVHFAIFMEFDYSVGYKNHSIVDSLPLVNANLIKRPTQPIQPILSGNTVVCLHNPCVISLNNDVHNRVLYHVPGTFPSTLGSPWARYPNAGLADRSAWIGGLNHCHSTSLSLLESPLSHSPGHARIPLCSHFSTLAFPSPHSRSSTLAFPLPHSQLTFPYARISLHSHSPTLAFLYARIPLFPTFAFPDICSTSHDPSNPSTVIDQHSSKVPQPSYDVLEHSCYVFQHSRDVFRIPLRSHSSTLAFPSPHSHSSTLTFPLPHSQSPTLAFPCACIPWHLFQSNAPSNPSTVIDQHSSKVPQHSYDVLSTFT